SDEELERIAGHAIRARENAYAPYSGFRVGAALLGESGTVYTGCNVENAAYPLTICAEQAAVARAVAEGERRFRAIAVASEEGEPCAPCGACRQVLFEFNPEMMVVMATEAGGRAVSPLRELLPRAFGPETIAGEHGSL